MNSQPIVFFGTEDFSTTTLQALIEAKFDVALVVTKPDSRRGRNRQPTPPSAKILASKYQIPVVQPGKLTDIIADVERLQSPAGVLVSYGKMIPESVIRLFTPGIINLHPSLLPRYRGPSPIESAILNREPKTGISIMALVPEMDAGPVYLEIEQPLSGKETAPELYKTLAKNGSKALVDNLPKILSGELQPLPQRESDATYCHLLTKSESLLDPAISTAAELEAQIRAYLDYPKSTIEIDGQRLIIKQASIAEKVESSLDIVCYDGSILRIEQLVAPSGRTMSSADYLRGRQ